MPPERAAQWRAGVLGWVFVAGLMGASFARSNDPLRDENLSLSETDRLYFQRHRGDNLARSQQILMVLLQRDPSDPQVLWRFGRGAIRAGERLKSRKERVSSFRRAEESLQRSLKFAPNNAEAHYWLGVAYGRRGQAQGLLKSLFLVRPIKEEMRKAIELDPSHGRAHHVLGEMLRQMPGFAGGSKKDAVAEFEKALSLSPNWTANHPSAAQAYLEIGEREKALDVLRRVFDVKTPDDPGEYEDNIKDAEEMMKNLAPGPA